MSAPVPASARRLSYVDWMRGLAIVIMIEAHVTDAWTLPADRNTFAYACAAILAGFAAPMFLFLAGVSVTLGASAGQRKLGDAARAAGRVRRRGWEVFGLAYLFRIQAYLLHPKATLTGMLKVDILNIMGPAIVVAAALWQWARTNGQRLVCFGIATLAVTLVTPLVRTSTLLDPLPDFVQWYLRPTPGRNNFTFFPWMGFVFAGAFVGVLLDRRLPIAEERRHQAVMGTVAAAFAGACYAGSYLPSIYADSYFWTSSPMFFLMRVGIVTAVLAATFFWEQRPRLLAAKWPWLGSPMAEFGRSSLFVYWIHVELVYGVATESLHRALTFNEAVAAFVVFTLTMFGMVLVKNAAVTRWKAWRASAAAAAPPPSSSER